MKPTAIFRLRPRAVPPDDPERRLRRRSAEVYVRAHSPDDARRVAARAEQRYSGTGQARPLAESAFLDEAIYDVREVAGTPHAASGPPAVLCGDITAQVARRLGVGRGSTQRRAVPAE